MNSSQQSRVVRRELKVGERDRKRIQIYSPKQLVGTPSLTTKHQEARVPKKKGNHLAIGTRDNFRRNGGNESQAGPSISAGGKAVGSENIKSRGPERRQKEVKTPEIDAVRNGYRHI